MLWTLTYNGTEKTLADWGLTQVSRTLASQDADTLSFTADGQAVDVSPLFPIKSTLILQRNRVRDSGGAWSGGVIWFAGMVIQIPRRGAPDAENNAYRVAGPWWYLKSRVFEKVFNVFNGYSTPGDTTTATFVQKTFSHSFLLLVPPNIDHTIPVPPGPVNPDIDPGKESTGQQIVEALNWALKPFVDAGAAPPFQVGTVTPDLDVPIQEVRDITCAEVIRMMLRWSPDAVTWFDYSTSPPTFHCQRRADFAPANIDVSAGNLVRDLRVNPRYDLQSSFVLISYEQTENVNGVSWMTPNTDQYPATLPGDALSFFNGLRFTVDLQGVQATTSSATLVCDAIDVMDPDWWIARHPQYEAHDPDSAAEDKIPIASFAIDFSTMKREPTNASEADKGYAQELTAGELTDWMTFKSQRITVSCRATITLRNGQVIANHPITYQLVSTNAASGTFQNTNIQSQAEPVPVGLARRLYDAVSVLQFEGEITLQEEDVSGQLGVGNLFNLTGGALAEWSAMNALVQRISENLDAGTTTVEFGPPGILSAGELVDLLRVNRNRVVRYNFGLAIGGVPNLVGGNVSLGRNTPEKNSSSTVGYDQAHVVSGTIDGSGAVVATSPGVTQWLPAGPANPATPYPPGSVTINQADAAGNTMKIQAVPVCFNGTKGKIYFLCSDFILDP